MSWQITQVARGGVALAALLAGLVGCSAAPEASAGAAATAGAARDTREVTYLLSGSATDADITIETPSGSTQRSVRVPLINKAGTAGLIFTMPAGHFVYLSAQNSAGYGDITCVIEVDGKTVAQNTATGGYAVATCEGRA